MTFFETGNACRFNATSAGLLDFAVGTAPVGKVTPENAFVVDTKVYNYFAQSADGTQWESGVGGYFISLHLLSRGTISGTSNNDKNKVNFTAPPVVDVYPSAQPTLETQGQTASLIAALIPSGTLMLFQQSAAPPGWTKQTTHNDKALRVVSGSASSGGSNSFSSVMAQTTVGSHTLTTGELASHSHGVPDTDIACGGVVSIGHSNSGASLLHVDSTDNAGGGGAHNHPITLSIQYVDVIICQKN